MPGGLGLVECRVLFLITQDVQRTASAGTANHRRARCPERSCLGGVVFSVSDLRLKRSQFDSGLYYSWQQLWTGCVHLLALSLIHI